MGAEGLKAGYTEVSHAVKSVRWTWLHHTGLNEAGEANSETHTEGALMFNTAEGAEAQRCLGVRVRQRHGGASAERGSGQPTAAARPLPATCSGAPPRCPAARGRTGRALPSFLGGWGRAGPDPHLPRYLRAGAREGGRWGKFVSVVGCAAQRGRSGRAGGSERSQGSGRRAAAGPRAEGGEARRACAAAAIRLAKGEAPAGMGQRGERAPCPLPLLLLLLLLLGEPGGGGRGPGQGCTRPQVAGRAGRPVGARRGKGAGHATGPCCSPAGDCRPRALAAGAARMPRLEKFRKGGGRSRRVRPAGSRAPPHRCEELGWASREVLR